jgi:hypothetical protein
MLALPLAFPHKCSQTIMLRITTIFSNPQYTENDFSGLLKFMAKYEVDKDFICTLLEVFISMRRPFYITRPEFLAPLLSARARLGDVDVVLGLLDQFF